MLNLLLRHLQLQLQVNSPLRQHLRVRKKGYRNLLIEKRMQTKMQVMMIMKTTKMLKALIRLMAHLLATMKTPRLMTTIRTKNIMRRTKLLH